MPVITINLRALGDHLNRIINEEWLEDLCFQYGLELDAIEVDEETKEKVAKIEIPANRPDILCLEGLSTALKCFLGTIEVPHFTLSCEKNTLQKVIVGKSIANIRPFILCAILRDLTLNEDSYRSFIDFQEKLHHNICRKRSLVSIGTHDLDNICGPFKYDAKPYEKIKFVPLIGTSEVNGFQLMNLLSNHQQLKHYLPLVGNSELLPVVSDINGTVLSVPPLINGSQSKITPKTKNILIEVTATDYSRANIVLNQLVCAFSLYCKDKFTIEPVEIEYEHNIYPPAMFKYEKLTEQKHVIVTPLVNELEFKMEVAAASKFLGIKPNLNVIQVRNLLKRMMINTYIIEEEGKELLKCFVPINRSDVLHPVDLYEDIGIAYGFNNLPINKLKFHELDKYNLFVEQIKRELSLLGISETFNWSLCKHSDCFENLLRTEDLDLVRSSKKNIYYNLNHPAVILKDAKTSEFEIVRTTLIQSLIKTIVSNKSLPLPQRIFEIGDIVLLDQNSPSGSKNYKHVAIAYSNNNGSGLEEVHGFLDQMLSKLGFLAKYSIAESNLMNPNICGIYYLVEINDPTFLRTRCVQVVVKRVEFSQTSPIIDIEKTLLNEEIVIGIMGVLHPKVLQNFSLTLPTSVLEIRLEPIIELLPETNFYDE